MENWGMFVPYIIGVIIILQVFFFLMNLQRMFVYKNIFSYSDSWSICRDKETDFVNGIQGTGNGVYDSIKESINKYLTGKMGSEIDFQLIKDSVDRHCDTVEDDINSQMPIPLYCGLAGTMVGVILGLGALLSTGSITALIGGTDGESGHLMLSAADGINDLLRGVAWAMIASICGIVLTTANSLIFKRYKLSAEKGKNEFFVWLQSKLLPELPTDTTAVLNQLVSNLNQFNDAFSYNTKNLGSTLAEVNRSYATQADIIHTIHDMDVMKVSTANITVLKELQDCTDKLEQFNDYLLRIRGYTDVIQKFNEQFREEANRLHVMEEIRDFFLRNKAEIAVSVTNEDVALRKALKKMEETSSQNIDELKTSLVEQSEKFKQLNQRMCDEYTKRLKEMPLLQTQLEQISKIPSQLQNLTQRLERTNNDTLNRMERALKDFSMVNVANSGSAAPIKLMPKWIKALGVVFMILVILAILGGAFLTVLCLTGHNPFIEQPMV